jgi:alkanesulfonate monooxygenase SsuD/methylene tetrahydromethanopterin reductase-like flavin-dependent oxidoreductase (luciferase family)
MCRCRNRAHASRKPTTSSPVPGPRTSSPTRGNSGPIAARHNIRITPGLAPGGLQDDIIRYYAQCLAAHGHAITPDHLSLGVSVYVADSKAQAVKECGPYLLYFNRTLFSHGNFTETSIQRQHGYASDASLDYVRPENRHAGEHAREEFRNATMDSIARQAERMPWGTPQEVAERIIALADHTGASTVQIGFNRGAMPQEMFLEQIRRFARDVLPIVQAHQVTRVPAAEAINT